MAPNFNGKPPVITPGSLVLVTGANGFVASHVADQLIQAGYRVRGTSRDVKKTDWMGELFDKTYGEGKFEAVTVKDMAQEGAFDAACEGMSYVARVITNLLTSVLTYRCFRRCTCRIRRDLRS